MSDEIKNPKNKKAQESGSGNGPADCQLSDSVPGLFYSPDDEMDRGWVKSFRKTKEWQWFKKPGMFRLFHYLILEANHKDGFWQGVQVKRGQLIAGRENLSEGTGLSVQQIRTCLQRLQNTRELTIKPTNKFSIITICNYDKYQNPEERINQQTNQQSTSNQPATNHKQEEIKNDKKKIYGEFQNVKLTEQEHDKLVKRFGTDKAKEKIEDASTYFEKIGPEATRKKYKSHYATILSWDRKNNPKLGDVKESGPDIPYVDEVVKKIYGK